VNIFLHIFAQPVWQILIIVKKISLQDIAKSLNISKSTISLVLNGRGDEKRVSKETQEKILKFAKEHNYKANQLARGLSRGKSDTIGLVVPNISDNFYARIARRIERKAEKSGYNVVFSSTGERKEKESKLIQSMLDRQVDGLIIASSQKNGEDIERLKRNKIPFVLIDRHYPEIDANHVIIDNKGGISLATEQLIKQGRKRIGFVSLKTELEAIRQRLLGYKQVMEKHGFQIEDGFVQELNYENVESDMYLFIKKMVQFPNSIDGIVFATHYLAATGLRELKKLNIRIPADVAIVSFGQMSAFDLIEPPITSIKLPSNEIGDKAVDILLQNIAEQSSVFQNVRLNTELIERKSCGAP
jgi:LacI family transcriptional regulator